MDLVQDPPRGCLADGMPSVTEDDQRDPRAVPFDDFGPLAVGVGTAVDESTDSRHDRSVHRLVSSGTGLNLASIEIEIATGGLVVVEFQCEADTGST